MSLELLIELLDFSFQGLCDVLLLIVLVVRFFILFVVLILSFSEQY